MAKDNDQDINESGIGKDLQVEEKLSEESGNDVESAIESTAQENNSTFYKVKESLSLGIAVLALIFILIVFNKLNSNMEELNSTVNDLDTKTASFQTTIDEKMNYVDREIGDVKSKVETSRRMAAILELKRALVTVREVSIVENAPEMRVKSEQLISNIESFLQDLSGEKKIAPAGTVEVIEEPMSVPSQN